MRILAFATLVPILLTGCVSQIKPDGEPYPKTSSVYYTGEYDAKPVHYKPLDVWMSSRKDDDEPKDIMNQEFIIDNKKALKPIYQIASRLLEGWPGKEPEFSIFISADPVRNTYGAKSLIGNEILINYKTLLNVESDDELASIIAHEIAHILLGHNKETDYINTAEQLFDAYHKVKVVHEVIQASSVNKVGTNNYKINIDQSIFSGLVQANQYREQANHFYGAFHGTLFNRGAEIEADLLALDLMVKAGYSPRGLQHSLERLSSAYETESILHKGFEALSKETMEHYLKALEKTLLSYQASGQIPDIGAIMSATKSQIIEDIKSTVKDSAIAFLSNTHPVPENRQEQVADYLDENYSRKERNRKPVKTVLTKLNRSGALTAIKNYKLAEDALVLSRSDDPLSAERTRRRAVSGVTSKDPYTRYIAYEVRMAQQKESKAIQNLELISSFLNFPTAKLVPVVNQFMEHGKYTRASQAIAAKEKYAGPQPGFYPAKIKIALHKGQTEKATELAEACLSNDDSNAEVHQACRTSGALKPGADPAPVGGFLNSLQHVSEKLSGIPGI